MLNLQKCAVIGCGNVGATCAYTLMHSGILSEIVLLDANANKAEGEAMDLNHALPFLSPMRIYAGTYEDLADCGIIIIAAGAGQAKGETRIDLLVTPIVTILVGVGFASLVAAPIGAAASAFVHWSTATIAAAKIVRHT